MAFNVYVTYAKTTKLPNEKKKQQMRKTPREMDTVLMVTVASDGSYESSSNMLLFLLLQKLRGNIIIGLNCRYITGHTVALGFNILSRYSQSDS